MIGCPHRHKLDWVYVYNSDCLRQFHISKPYTAFVLTFWFKCFQTNWCIQDNMARTTYRTVDNLPLWRTPGYIWNHFDRLLLINWNRLSFVFQDTPPRFKVNSNKNTENRWNLKQSPITWQNQTSNERMTTVIFWTWYRHFLMN